MGRGLSPTGTHLILCHTYALSGLLIEILVPIIYACSESIIDIICSNKTLIGDGPCFERSVEILGLCIAVTGTGKYFLAVIRVRFCHWFRTSFTSLIPNEGQKPYDDSKDHPAIHIGS